MVRAEKFSFRPICRRRTAMLNLLKTIRNSNDMASMVLLTGIVVVASWIIALPFNRSVQETYLRRFHLASPNFAVWAIQQPVPSMYNFENRVWASQNPVTTEELNASMIQNQTDRQSTESAKRVNRIKTDPVNHFPTRYFTFGETRSFLKQNPSRYYYLRTRYRDLEIRSAFEISPVSDSELKVDRLEVTID